MRSLFFVMVVLGAGCVADSAEPPPPPPVVDTDSPAQDVTMLDQHGGSDVDVCALASLLPSDDICSLICDPSAMAERMVSDGNARGSCYQLYCSLPEEQHVLVGVCLPP